MPSLAAFPKMLEQDRRRRGFTIGQVAWRLGISPAEHRSLEAGEPIHDTRQLGLAAWSHADFDVLSTAHAVGASELNRLTAR